MGLASNLNGYWDILVETYASTLVPDSPSLPAWKGRDCMAFTPAASPQIPLGENEFPSYWGNLSKWMTIDSALAYRDIPHRITGGTIPWTVAGSTAGEPECYGTCVQWLPWGRKREAALPLQDSSLDQLVFAPHSSQKQKEPLGPQEIKPLFLNII